MFRKREKLRLKSRFVSRGHAIGLTVTPSTAANGAYGAHYVLPSGARLASSNGRGKTKFALQVNGRTFKISFQAAEGKVESNGPDRDGTRHSVSTASVEDLTITDVTDPSNPEVRLEAKQLAARASSTSFAPKKTP